ncbi:MAG: flagellar basal-body MS-ring/collar protein FliF [Gemmatimonadota bacterium]
MPPFVQQMFGRMSGGRQATIIAVGVIVTVLVLGVSRWATQPVMVPLYSDVPIENVSKMTDKLVETAIPYEYDQTGSTILVAASDLARARVELARESMPNAGRPGLELFDKPSWGMTDFTQRVNYRRALEGELERTIGKMTDIKSVQVHLALEDDQVFKKNERKSKASVTLSMANGQRPAETTVRGIASLVAGSVGGLEPDHVTIVDERGQALTTESEGSIAGLSSQQLVVQREVESYMEKKADEILSSLVGSGNARVQVAASINFDKVERTTQAVDPDKQATNTEQRAEVTPGSPQQGAGYSTVATSYENTRSTENFSGAIGNLKKLTVAVLVADKVTIPPTLAGATTPAAPVVTRRAPQEIANIETLVRNALGVDSTRGDMISVVSAPFDMPVAQTVADTLPTPDLMTRLQSNPKPIVAIAALVVLLIVAVVTMGALKPKKLAKGAATEALPGATGYAELPSSASMQQALQVARDNARMQAEIDEIQRQAEEQRVLTLPPPPSTPERDQAMATVDQRPEAALRVVRGWLRT